MVSRAHGAVICAVVCASFMGGCVTQEGGGSGGGSTPSLSIVGADRFEVEGGEEGGELEEITCEALDGGGWHCLWSDGMGTTCDFNVSADEELISQHCVGNWGTYDCEVEAELIECRLTTDDEECMDLWSGNHDLIWTSCTGLPVSDPVEDGQVEDEPTDDNPVENPDPIDDSPRDEDPIEDWGSEECYPNDDGSTTCIFDDGFVRCEGIFELSGAIRSQTCTDGSWTYECMTEGDVLSCALVFDGDVLCEDLLTPYGELIEHGCEEYFGPLDFDEEYRDDAPSWSPEDCELLADDTIRCTMDDDYSRCEALYDSEGSLLTSVCISSDGLTYECAATDDMSVVCGIHFDGELLCEETYTREGDLVVSSCDELYGEL